MKNKHQIIEELCGLASQVGTRVFKDKYAHDCFCCKPNNFSFHFEEPVLDFILNAVNDAIIAKEKENV